MLEILKNIIWTHSYSMSRSHKENCCWDGINGLKNPLLTKTNPFFHLYAFTFKFRKNKTQVKWRKTGLKSEIPRKQNNLSFVYHGLYMSQKNNLTFFLREMPFYRESIEVRSSTMGAMAEICAHSPPSPHPIPQNSVTSFPP